MDPTGIRGLFVHFVVKALLEYPRVPVAFILQVWEDSGHGTQAQANHLLENLDMARVIRYCNGWVEQGDSFKRFAEVVTNLWRLS